MWSHARPLDGAIQLDGPHPVFGADQKPEDVRALAEENFLPAKRMAISFAPVVVNTGRELILFDTGNGAGRRPDAGSLRSEEHTSELQSLMRISYAVFCLKKKSRHHED